MVRVGLVGCGTIGSQLALALQRRFSTVARIVALHDTDRAHACALQRKLRHRPPIVSLSRLIRASQVVLEAASSQVAGWVVRQALGAQRSVLVMSVGGLLSDDTWQRLARRSKGKVYIPSGAIAGLDGVKALAVGRIRAARLTSRKPPRALAAAPYVRRKGLRLSRLTRPSVIFEGPARAAVQAFPQNTNVAASLALALSRNHAPLKRPSSRRSRADGAGPRLRVRVVADPTIRTNVHELEVEGEYGRMRCRIESPPSANPKTSELAVQSAVATLARLFDSVNIGT